MAITNTIYAATTVSITDLRRNPGQVIEAAGGAAVAILNHNRPAAYLVPADVYEKIMDALADSDLPELVRARRDELTVRVAIDEL